MNVAILLTILLGLYVDEHSPWEGQLLVGLFVWALFFVLLARSRGNERRVLLACLVLATAGELFLALVWELYTYRLVNLPAFVPPGHVLLFALGRSLAGRLPMWAAWAVPAAAAPVIAALAFAARDTLGPVLLVLLVGCIAFGPSPRLYATMFVLALAMELYGTWMGNWIWSPQDRWLGLQMMNPPVAAGAFYCVLDLLVLAFTAAKRTSAAAPPR